MPIPNVPNLSYRLHSLYCGKCNNNSKTCRDLDLDQSLIVRTFFIKFNKFKVPRLLIIVQRDTYKNDK